MEPIATYCKSCSTQAIFYERYDAHFCVKCLTWVERCCGEPDCDFCSSRPQIPVTVQEITVQEERTDK